MNNMNDDISIDDLENQRPQGVMGAATDVAAEILDPELSADADAVGRGEGVGEAKEVEGLSHGRIVARRFRRHAGALFGMSVLALIALLSLVTMGGFGIKGAWWEQDPNKPHDVLNGGAPTLHMPRWLGGSGFTVGRYPFGQNEIGVDNFAQVMKGIQTSLIVMVVLGLVVLLIGTTVGALSGYYRGWVDSVLMRITDLFITLPVIVLGAVLGRMIYTLPSKWGWSEGTKDLISRWMPFELAVILGFILWPGLARLVRSEFLSLREREFVDSARVAGASNFRIITRHILPNTMGVIIVNISLLMASSVVLETALSYLGFGIQPPSVSLGRLISNNQTAFDTRPWLFWWPGLFIVLMALSVNFIGDGLRDAFDPRTKRTPSEAKMEKMARLNVQAAAGGASTPSMLGDHK